MNFSLRLITALFFSIFPAFLFSQTYTIGDSTGVNTSSTYPAPYGDQWESTRAQYLYLASELTTAGVTAGNITRLGFKVVNVGSSGVHENWTLKMLLTTSVTLTNGTWQNSGITTVFGPVDYTPAVGLNEYTLSAPFYWDGTSNLVIDVCHSANPANPGSFATENAIVQLTTGLVFNGSRTRAKNNDSAVCTTSDTQEQGTRMSRPVLSLTLCYPPQSLAVNGVTSITGNLRWSPPTGYVPAGYMYTYGAQGYSPGVSGTELGSGSTADTSVVIGGLNGSETYSFWVRSDCGDGFSRWAGPLNFTTDPSCSDLFLDPGGLSPYPKNQNVTKVLCPDIADNALKMSFLLPLSIGAGDTLRIYNGDNTAAPLLGTLSGVYAVPPAPFACTTASGCLTAQFTSDSITTAQDIGWTSLLSCAPLPPDVCYSVLELESSNVTFNSADVTWVDMFGAENYHWELVELPYLGLSSVVQSDLAFIGTSVHFDGLEAGTLYQFAVRTNCTNAANSVWDTITFTTPVNCDGTLIQCGQTYSFTAEKTGLWNLDDCGTATPGKERVFRFVAPNTRAYNLEITAASGGFVSYLFKTESGGCNDADWNCIDDFNVPGISNLPPVPGNKLTAGTLYYIVADPQTTGPVSQTFKITECDTPNDSPINAIEIQVNVPCDGNVYSNFGATLDPNEPDPDVDDTDGLVGRWLDAADETVWFKFEAPASGTVTILSDPQGTHLPNEDTQIALYRVVDEADYSTFELLVSDEDNGNTLLGFNSVVSYTGLEDGEIYYIQVDGYGATGEGSFCIAVIETVERVDDANCGTDYSATDVNQNSWYNIWTIPDNLDIGPLVAAVNPLGINLDTVLCRAQNSDEPVAAPTDLFYLPLYYKFSATQPFSGNISLRLFFTDAEFASLKDSAHTPGKTIADLKVSRFNGGSTDCSPPSMSNTAVTMSGVKAVQLDGTFFLEFDTDSLGEFGAYLAAVPLPLELLSFSGNVFEKYNLLQWTTLSEKDVAWHIVERSPNGTIWTEVGRVAGQANSVAPLPYSLEDWQPLAKAYYRLRSVDFDGSTSLSNAILLTRRFEQFGIASVFPSPTNDWLTVQFSDVNEEDVTLRFSDFNGRIVLEQVTAAQKGINEAQISLGDFPAGVYTVTIANEVAVSEPVRVVKL